ncbi:hypothetical protein D1007_29791 [Hordeum vulgare]|nr:hypothetical protein D1007_29791 [Hordeum vulgare]
MDGSTDDFPSPATLGVTLEVAMRRDLMEILIEARSDLAGVDPFSVDLAWTLSDPARLRAGGAMALLEVPVQRERGRDARRLRGRRRRERGEAPERSEVRRGVAAVWGHR